LHITQLMPLTLTVSCFSKIQIGFTFLVPAHPGSHGQRTVKWECVCANITAPSPVCILAKHATISETQVKELDEGHLQTFALILLKPVRIHFFTVFCSNYISILSRYQKGKNQPGFY